MNRNSLLAFCVLLFAYQLGLRVAIPSVLNSELQQYFNINAGQFGNLFSTAYLVYTLMQIPGGIILDRVSVRCVTVTSFTLFSIGVISFTFSHSYIQALISQMILGFSSSCCFILVMKVVNDYFPPQRVAFVSSVAIFSGCLGPTFGSIVLSQLVSAFFWKNVLLVFGMAGLVFAIVGLIFIRDEKATHSERSLRGIAKDLKAIVTNGQYFWLGLFSMAMIAPSTVLCETWGVFLIERIYELSTENATFAISLISIGSLLGGPLVAHLCKVMNSYKKVMFYCSLHLLAWISLISLFIIPIPALCFTLFVIGIVKSAQFLAFPAVLATAPKSIAATLTGFVNTVTMCGSVLAVSGVGHVLDFSRCGNEGYSICDCELGLLSLTLPVLFAMFTLLFISQTRKG